MTVTHTIARTVTAAGIVEYPRGLEEIFDHEGETLEAGDGTPTNVWMSSKRRWRLIWDSPLPAVVERWRSRYKARGGFTFTNPYGESYTATIPVGGFARSIAYVPSASTAAGTTYTLSVDVWEV